MHILLELEISYDSFRKYCKKLINSPCSKARVHVSFEDVHRVHYENIFILNKNFENQEKSTQESHN